MVGKYDIEVVSDIIRYKLTIKRNITILQGDSGTGKTTLIGMIQEYEASGGNSSTQVICDVECKVMTRDSWVYKLKENHNCILFMDEGYGEINSDKFAAAVKETDNYVVLVTREDLKNLPYSIHEIFKVRESKKYANDQSVLKQLPDIDIIEFKGSESAGN